MELTKKQKEIITTDEEKVVVIAASGSGKTLVLTERVKFLLKKGIDPAKIVVITFTNAAAEEMKERIGPNSLGCFIGTIHAYANYLLICKGLDTRQYLDLEQFDELFKMVKDNPSVIQEVDYLLLDEAQDSTEEQFEFLISMVNPKNFFVVGDHRQSIYSFTGGNPDYIYNLSKAPGVKSYNLNENFRSAPEILSFAKDFLASLSYKFFDDSVAKSKKYGQIFRLEYTPEKIARFILDNENSNWGDWFVLARTNQQVNEIFITLEAFGIPCETFKKAELTNNELNERLNNNTVKVLTIHTSKGLENKCVVVAGAQYYNEEEKRVNYVAATRARELLVWCYAPKRKKKINYESWE